MAIFAPYRSLSSVVRELEHGLRTGQIVLHGEKLALPLARDSQQHRGLGIVSVTYSLGRRLQAHVRSLFHQMVVANAVRRRRSELLKAAVEVIVERAELARNAAMLSELAAVINDPQVNASLADVRAIKQAMIKTTEAAETRRRSAEKALISPEDASEALMALLLHHLQANGLAVDIQGRTVLSSPLSGRKLVAQAKALGENEIK